MEIDIISYTDAQFAALTEEQLLQVKNAQLKKNRLAAALEKDLQREKQRLMDNGILFSSIWRCVQEKLQETYEQEEANIREGLLFYLRFAAKPEGSALEEVPYTVDYSLSNTERFEIVRDYYMDAYTDPSARFEKFKTDSVAMQYLGELYAPLYDYFLEKVTLHNT